MTVLLKSCFCAEPLITVWAHKLSGTLIFSQVRVQGTLNMLQAPVAQVLWLSSPLAYHFMILEFVRAEENTLARVITAEKLGVDIMN